MYSEPSSLSMYRVIAEPLVRIGEVKSSLMTFSPATTPSRKMRCSDKVRTACVSGRPVRRDRNQREPFNDNVRDRRILFVSRDLPPVENDRRGRLVS